MDSETVVALAQRTMRKSSISDVLDPARRSGTWRAFLIIARLTLIAFTTASSAYCLLAYIPFTYQWVINFNLIGWLPAFARSHAYIYWLVFGMVAATIAGDVRCGATRRLVAGFLVFHTILGVGLLLHPLLLGVQNDISSFMWSMAWLFPPLWLAAIDWRSEVRRIEWGAVRGNDRRLLLAASLNALFVSTLYAGLSYVRAVSPNARLGASERLAAIIMSIALHLLAFALLFTAARLIKSISQLFEKSSQVEFFFCHVLAALLSAVIIRKVMLPTIAFNNRLADFFSLVAGFSVVFGLMGISLRMRRQEEGPVIRGLDLALKPLTPPRLGSNYGRVAWVVLAVTFAWAAPASVAMKDWDFLLQKVSALVIWPIGFASFYCLCSRVKNRQYKLWIIAITAVLAVVCFKFIRGSIPSVHDIHISDVMDRYSAYDPSFTLIREISAESTDDDALYDYLRANTNILPSTRVAPVEIRLVDDLKPTKNARPNVFIIVIDSLRRDYLSPYNSEVSFTPNVERFANESVVMERAFTRYGGTALSEPAIWAGAMLLHKQYVLPFYSMNSLQKVLDTDGYQAFISMDPILTELLRATPAIVPLDKRSDNHNFDLCWSLKELESKLEERRGSQPAFAYLQPWNIHVNTIGLERRTVPPGEEYTGFWAPYAARVKYMDKCFGEFLNYLRARGLYDNSIVILTSDHGDCLGEDGRWGHSYWIYPEIIRIPLIIHLPSALRAAVKWDSNTVSFSTDITPSLYYLLGHKPLVKNRLFGHSLFSSGDEELLDRSEESYVVASSYGAVYGVLSGNGRWLFLADGVKNKDYFYDLDEEISGNVNHFSTRTREEQRKMIRDHIALIDEFYAFGERR